MAATKDSSDNGRLLNAVQDLLILQLGQAGLGTDQIRAIAGVGMDRVNRIIKPLNELKRQQRQQQRKKN